MKYEVLKDYQDVEKVPVDPSDPNNKETRGVVKFELKAGETFIPAETNYPSGKVDKLVLDGTLKAVAREKPVAAKKK